MSKNNKIVTYKINFDFKGDKDLFKVALGVLEQEEHIYKTEIIGNIIRSFYIFKESEYGLFKKNLFNKIEAAYKILLEGEKNE